MKSNGKQTLKRTVLDQSSSEDEDEVHGEEDCLFCGNVNSNSAAGEGWIRSIPCSHWAHDKCAGVDDNDDKEIIFANYVVWVVVGVFR